MTNLKRTVAIGTIIMSVMAATSVTALAAQGNPNISGTGIAARPGYSSSMAIRQQDGTYQKTGVRPGTGRGAGGAGKLLGVGGMGLQDGSCYTSN